MKGKKEYIILGAIIMAIVAYLVFRPTDRSTYELPILAKLPDQEITRIEIITPRETVTINRKGDEWLVGPEAYPADPEKIDRMLDILSELKLTAMVSETGNDDRYDLNPEKRIRVKAWAGKDLKREFDVGKTAGTFRHTFVKIAGDDRVFHAENNFRDRFETTIEALRDKTVLAFKPDEILSIKMIKDEKTTLFEKKRTAGEDTPSDESKKETTPEAGKESFQWMAADNRIADPNKIKSFLATLSALECETYLDDPADEKLKDPVIDITLSGTKEYRLTVYAKEQKEEDDPRWPATSSENDYPFFLSDWKAENIVKDPEDLMPDKPKPEKEVKE